MGVSQVGVVRGCRFCHAIWAAVTPYLPHWAARWYLAIKKITVSLKYIRHGNGYKVNLLATNLEWEPGRWGNTWMQAVLRNPDRRFLYDEHPCMTADHIYWAVDIHTQYFV